jgi:hypothetical protein
VVFQEIGQVAGVMSKTELIEPIKRNLAAFLESYQNQSNDGEAELRAPTRDKHNRGLETMKSIITQIKGKKRYDSVQESGHSW